MQKCYYIETYGCEMNKAESNALIAELEKVGYRQSLNPLDAEWVIVNTCSVRNSAEERVVGRLGYFKSLKTEAPLKVAVMGCMAERLKEEPELFKKYQVDELIGSFDKQAFAAKLTGRAADDIEKGYQFFNYHGSDGNLKAYIPIMHGCNNFCSYCIVPYVRGREISRSTAEIIAEIKQHMASGIKEIILLGQNVNSYQYENIDFPALIRLISEVEGDAWFRFTSSHPKDFNKDLLDALAADDRFCTHLHLAAQHGSNRILKEMNRHYTREHYKALADLAREKWPNVAITTDLMVGFPGETDEDYEDLMDFVRQIQFADAYTYQYSDREGTKASDRTDKVAEEVKTARLMNLIEVQRSISKKLIRNNIGSVVKVLVEHEAKENGKLFGHTARNENVVFPASADKIGTFVMVTIEDARGQTMLGSLKEA